MSYQRFNNQKFNQPAGKVLTVSCYIASISSINARIEASRVIILSSSSSIVGKVSYVAAARLTVASSSDVTAKPTKVTPLAATLTSSSNYTASIGSLRYVSTIIMSTSNITSNTTRCFNYAASIMSSSNLSNRAIHRLRNILANVSSQSNLQGKVSYSTITRLNIITQSSIKVAIGALMGTSSSMYSNSVFVLKTLNRLRNASGIMRSHSNILIKLLNTISGAINGYERYFDAWIDIYLDGDAPIRLTRDDIESFTLLEELKADTNNPLGDITANEFTLSIDNSNRRFSPTNHLSDLHGKLKPGIKIEPYLAIELGEDTYHTMPLGTFYTGDWNAPTQSTVCSVTAYDRLQKLINLPFEGIRVLVDTTIADLYAIVFDVAGLQPHEYNIDPVLHQHIVKVAHIPADSIGAALKYLAEASGSYCYVDRSNVVQAKVINYNEQIAARLSDSNQIVSSSVPSRYLETYGSVNVPYYMSTKRENVEVLAMSQLNVAPGDSLIEGIRFTTGPVGRVTKIEIKGPSAVQLRYYDATADTMSLSIHNSAGTANIDISVYGDTYEFTSVDNKVRNEDLMAILGDKELRIDNRLVQTEQQATQYINNLKIITDNPQAVVSADIRGNPAITPTGIVEIVDRTNLMSEQYVVVTRSTLEYTGGIRGIIDGYVIPRRWDNEV